MLRSILAVFAGVVVWGVLSQVVLAIVKSLAADDFDENSIPQTAAMFGTMLGFSVIYSVAAGFTAGAIASDNVMTHAVILGCVNLAIGIAVQAMYWNQIPLWYHLVFLALVLPLSYTGGLIAKSVFA